jgi:diacylglycerol kinase (ATP)
MEARHMNEEQKAAMRVEEAARSPHKGKTGFERIWYAALNSIAGLRAAFGDEDAFRQECLFAAILIPVALLAPASGVGRALMAGSVVLVLIVELLNSAVEAAVDLVSLEEHALAKRAKDFASAAVMLALINVPLVWCLVLFT